MVKSIPKISLLFWSFPNHIQSMRSGFNQLQPVSASYSQFLCFRLNLRVIRNKILVSKCPVFVIHHLYPAMLIIRKTWFKLVFCISHLRHNKLLRLTYFCVYFEEAPLHQVNPYLWFLCTTLVHAMCLHATHWQFSHVRNKLLTCLLNVFVSIKPHSKKCSTHKPL